MLECFQQNMVFNRGGINAENSFCTLVVSQDLKEVLLTRGGGMFADGLYILL